MSVQKAIRRALVPQLQRELQRQNCEHGATAARAGFLDRLGAPELGVVVTGQQVGLFLGPALAFYKAATAIELARRASAAQPTLPIFWLQSEDHDGDEVQSAHVLDESHDLRCVTLEPSGDPRASMAERSLGPNVVAALDQFADATRDAPFRDEAVDLLRAHYRPEATWVEAFGGALAQVFNDEGLLTFNPRTQVVAECVTEIHRRALERHTEVDAALLEGTAALEREGQSPVVKPRPGCSLSFFHSGGRAGARHRLQHSSAGWTDPASGTCYSTSDLLTRLDREPLAFSTSSLLRVITQQSLLPVVAQVAGPAEARYLQQIPPLLQLFECSALEVVARAKLVVSDPRSRKRLSRLGLDAARFDGADAVLRRLAAEDGGLCGADLRSSLETKLARELDALTPELTALDPNLKRAIERTKRHVAKGMARLGDRVDRARERHDSERVATVDKLARVFTPGGHPQERCLGTAHFIAQWGLPRFKAAVFCGVKRHLDMLDSGQPPQLIEVVP